MRITSLIFIGFNLAQPVAATADDFRSAGEQKPGLLIGDFKRFTSKEIVKAIISNPKESRKELFLEYFSKAPLSSSNVNVHQFWQHDNHPIELWSMKR